MLFIKKICIFSSLLIIGLFTLVFLSPLKTFAATDFTITTPTSAIGTSTPSRAISLTVTGGSVGGSNASFALSDGGAGGVFYPASPVTITANSAASTVTQFVYIAPSNATGTITLQAVATGGITATHTLALPISTASKFAYDTFTGTAGTNILSHTPNIGGPWAKAGFQSGTMNKLIDGTNGMYDSGTGHASANWMITTAPSTNEHDVVATFSNINNTTTIPDISTFISNDGNTNGYRYAMYQGNYVLVKYVNNVGTVLFGGVGTITQGSTHTLRLAIRNINGSQYLFPMSDGVLVNAPILDNDLTSGYPGQDAEIPASQTPASTDSVVSNFIGANVDWFSASPATSYTLTGPTSGAVNQVSTNFTITPNGTYTGTLTLSDGSAGGTFSSSTLVFSNSAAAQTFTYTPGSTGSKTISVTSSPTLTNPSSITFTSYASNWTPQFTDNFNRADGALGNNWIDTTSVASVSSNRFRIVGGGGAPWTNSLVLRPTSENQLNQRMTFSMLPGSNMNALFGSFRVQAPGTEYAIGLTNIGAVGMYRIVNGSLTELTAGERSFAIDTSHTYQLDASVTGASPAILSATTTDLTTNTIVATSSISDTSSALQTAGQIGFFSSSDTSSGYYYMDNFTSYTMIQPSATSYTFTGPSSGNVNAASSNFTITPNGTYQGTITLSDNGGGGTFSSSTLVFASTSAAQTFTYTPSATGTKVISVTSSPALTNPSSISYTATIAGAGVIAVNNSNLVWSPYNWRFSGSTYAETLLYGAYVKVAFTGSTLSLGIDTSPNTGVDLSTTHVHAYIDGASNPIDANLSQLSNGVLPITSSISSGNHYAIIYLSQIYSLNARWTNPVAILRITKIQLANDGSGNILSLSTTPLARKARKVAIFGDSITEGSTGPTTGEKAYSAILGQQLGVEYGQIGYGSLGWSYPGNGGVPQFYDSTTPANSVWRNFDATHSRIVDNNNLSSGFIDGRPDAVFINLGINDANANSGSSLMRTKTTAWLNDVRQTVGSSTAIYVISPFNYGNTSNSTYVTYKTALIGGVTDYQANHPSDNRVYIEDLGTGGYTTVQNNSSDNLHPNDTGSSILGNQLATLAAPYLSIFSASPTSLIQNSTANTVTLTGINTLWTLGTPGSPLFTLSGGTGASIVSQTVTSSTTATLSLNAGSAAGTLVLIDPTNNSTTTITIGADVTAPTISVPAIGINDTSANISWLTNEPATSQIEYGTTTSYYASTTLDTTLSTGHSQLISNLLASTTYHFRIRARDTSSNLATSTDYTFTTIATPVVTPSTPTSTSPSGSTRSSRRHVVINGIVQTGEVVTTVTTSNQTTEGCLPGYNFSPLTGMKCSTTVSTPTSPSSYTFTRDLTLGSEGDDVKQLQMYLNTHGFSLAASGVGSQGFETTTFGALTKAALSRFQAAKGISPAVGYFGVITRGYVTTH